MEAAFLAAAVAAVAAVAAGPAQWYAYATKLLK